MVRRLNLLAARFESLGSLAAAQQNDGEAAAFFENALRAEPGRPSAKQSLEALEQTMRSRSRETRVQTR